MSKKVISIFFLLFFGTAGSFGAIFNIQSLMGMAYLTALSPMPLVFDPFRGLDFWALQGSVALTLIDGKQIEFPIDHRAFAGISGAHIRKIAYLAPSTLAPVVSKHRAFFALKKGFCNFGPLTKDMGLSEQVAKIETFIYDSRGEFKWYDQASCE